MLKKSIILLFIIVASIHVNAQEGWFKQKINEKVTVNFPYEPKKINDMNYGINKDGVIYLVTFIDILKATGMKKEDFDSGVTTQQFADDFASGLIGTMSGYSFGKTKIAVVKDAPAYQMSGRNEEKKTNTYLNIVFVDGIAYSISCYIPDGKLEKYKDTFLTNIHITK